MIQAAGEEIGHGGQADMGVGPDVDAAAGSEVARSGLIPEDERTDHLPFLKGQGTVDFEAADIDRPRHDYQFHLGLTLLAVIRDCAVEPTHDTLLFSGNDIDHAQLRLS